MAKKEKYGILIKNSKAHFEYFLSDFLECGIELKGTEIKSIKSGKANLNDSYVIFSNNEAFILNMHISEYEKGNIFNHSPLRTRKLLMHKNEIFKYASKVKEKGFSCVPTKLYLKNGKAKIEIALAKGKKLYDKRQVMKERDDKRNINKSLRENNKYGE